jgi:transcriptional regulator MraZ
MFFNGNYPCTLDSKGRVSLPARFRKVLGQEDHAIVYLLPGAEEGSILIYPEEAWLKIVEVLRELPKDENSAALRAYAGAQSYDTEVDRQGRIMISKVLVEDVRISKDLVVAGGLDKMVLWNAEAFAAQKDKERATFQKLANSVIL